MKNLHITLILFTFSACHVNPNPASQLTQSNEKIPMPENTDTYQIPDTENDGKIEISFREDSIQYADTDFLTEEIYQDYNMTEPPCGICAMNLEAEQEICNGQDDDCDCLTDEDWADTLGTPCQGYLESGFCSEIGIVVCNPNANWELMCSSANENSLWITPDYIPAEECNAIDDNCDGQIDEVCTQPGPCGICAQGQMPMQETCNGLDDDCDCETDEDWADMLGTPCKGYYLDGIFLEGYCTELGEVVCNSVPGHGQSYLRCSSADPSSAFTIPDAWDDPDGCDGIDIDCDGLIDEDCVE